MLFVYTNFFNNSPQKQLELGDYGVTILNPEEMPGLAIFAGETAEDVRRMIVGMYSQSGLPLYEATKDGLECWPDRDFADKVLQLTAAH
jgi:hypothetical protein